MDGLTLIALLDGQRVALPASAIESVVEIEAVTPVPLAARHVAGLAALRSRVLTVIDTYAALGLPARAGQAGCHAAVVTVDGHSYGLMVDEVEDVVQLDGHALPLRSGLDAGWNAAAVGMVEHQDGTLLLLDPARLVAGAAAQRVASAA